MIQPFSLKRYFTSFSKLPKAYKILYILFFLTFTVISVIRALKKGDNSDFHVFWLAGNNFFLGNDLYFLKEQARQLLYPPFAAALFGIIAIFPFKVAAVLFSIFNMGLWAGCVLLSKHIIEYFTKIKISPLVVLLTLIFSITFHISNLNLLQVNLVLFFFMLLFIYNYFRENFFLAALFIAAATCFKVTPIIFIGWVFFRGNFKTFAYIILALFLFVAIPLLLRGIEMGIYDIEQFLATLSREIPQTGLTKEDFTNNRSLRGLVTNYMIQLPGIDDSIKSFLVSISSVLLGLVYVAWLFILRIKKISISAYEFAGTFLVILLCSAVTRTAHMVTLVFPLLLFLSVSFATKSRKFMIFTLLVCSMFILAGGKSIDHILLERINVYGLAMLLGFIATLVFSFKKTNHFQDKDNA